MSCIQRHIFRVKTLYKTILKLHRGLPLEVQELGNNYVKDEFRRHKHLDRNSKQTIGFMFGWTEYAIDLAKQLTVPSIQRGGKIGKDLETLDSFREEQIAQLYELFKASKVESKSEDVVETKEQK